MVGQRYFVTASATSVVKLQQFARVATYRCDVETEYFLEKPWDADENGVETPICCEVGDNGCPYWYGCKNFHPWYPCGLGRTETICIN